jgi:hypothetical protein
MNYRRGLQRVYAVLTVAWVAVLLFALPADRLKFWSATEEWGASDKPVGNPNDWTPVKETAIDYGSHSVAPLPPGAILVDPSRVTPVAPSTLTDADIQKLDAAKGVPFGHSPGGKGVWLAGVLFLPPVAGYAAIFLLVPWVYRGFKPAKQI